MSKKTFFWILAFIGFCIWHAYEISILHKNIKKVRKEAWFDSQRQTTSEVIDIKYCLEHLEARINQYHGEDPDYPSGYPLWEKKEKRERDPLLELMIDQCL